MISRVKEFAKKNSEKNDIMALIMLKGYLD
jgi:hypothetical protein